MFGRFWTEKFEVLIALWRTWCYEHKTKSPRIKKAYKIESFRKNVVRRRINIWEHWSCDTALWRALPDATWWRHHVNSTIIQPNCTTRLYWNNRSTSQASLDTIRLFDGRSCLTEYLTTWTVTYCRTPPRFVLLTVPHKLNEQIKPSWCGV